MGMLTAIYISQCLLKIADEGDNSDMTNLKLQKLLYYAQGTCLSLFNRKLFKEDIVKWQYGPVVAEVYHHYKLNGSNVIHPSGEVDLSKLDEDQLNLLEDVYEFFGQFSAIKLMDFTHSESPWLNAEMNQVIDEDSIKSFFDTIVIKD